MTTLKTLKRKMISCAVYLLLLAVLITGVTTAKYTDSATVLSSYGAASFNTVILGGRTDEDGNRIIEALSESMDAAASYDFIPGMTYDSDPSSNTAKLYPFSVANGVTDENVSEIGVMFTLTLKTAANLPITFSVRHGENMLFTGQPEIIEGENADDASWTQYKFYETAEAMENNEEASFVLDGNTLNYEDFTLVVEWPVTETSDGNSNSIKYMKEVEMFELVVDSTSVDLSAWDTIPEPEENEEGETGDSSSPAGDENGLAGGENGSAGGENSSTGSENSSAGSAGEGGGSGA